MKYVHSVHETGDFINTAIVTRETTGIVRCMELELVECKWRSVAKGLAKYVCFRQNEFLPIEKLPLKV